VQEAGKEALPRRVRDYHGRDRALIVGVFVLTLVPFVVALVRARQDGWVPSGDEANIATRSLDVFSRHPPLTGLPTTSYLTGSGIFTSHPGPIEFYLLAVPLRAFGANLGMPLTAAAINAAAVIVTLWVILRRAGLLLMLWALVVLQAVMWSAGTALLTDTLSSNMPTYALLCTAVIVWAVVDGDFKLVPVGVVFGSYAAQQHLSSTFFVGVLVFVGLVAFVAGVVVRARRHDSAAVRQQCWYAAVAGLIGVVMWLPVFIEQATRHPGNLGEILRFARDDKRAKVGWGSGLTQLVHAVGPPTVVGRTDWTGFDFTAHAAVWRSVGAGVVVGVVVALGCVLRRNRAFVTFAGVALVTVAAGVVTGANVPVFFEESRVNLYRWTWTAAFMTWTAIGWGIALVVARRVVRVQDTLRIAQAVLFSAAALIVAATVIVSGRDDHNREVPAFAYEPGDASAVLRRIDHGRPVVVDLEGAAGISVGEHVVFRMIQDGLAVQFPSSALPFFGTQRKYVPASDPTILVVKSGRADMPRPAGRVIRDELFDPQYTALLNELTDTARSSALELAPDAHAIVTRDVTPSRRPLVEGLLSLYAKDPRGVVANSLFLKLVEDGLVRAPAFDVAKLQRLQVLATRNRRVQDDERLQIYLLTPQELHDANIEGLS
jgi:hypothetical protein